MERYWAKHSTSWMTIFVWHARNLQKDLTFCPYKFSIIYYNYQIAFYLVNILKTHSTNFCTAKNPIAFAICIGTWNSCILIMCGYHLVPLFINVVYLKTVCVAPEKRTALDLSPSFLSNILKNNCFLLVKKSIVNLMVFITTKLIVLLKVTSTRLWINSGKIYLKITNFKTSFNWNSNWYYSGIVNYNIKKLQYNLKKENGSVNLTLPDLGISANYHKRFNFEEKQRF